MLLSGGDNNINVVLADYKPDVKCDSSGSPGPEWDSAVAIFTSMRASKRLILFGSPEEHVDQALPVTLISRKENP